jgi:hypothetical protein
MCAAADPALLDSIPDDETVNYDVMTVCSLRRFERLPGLVDVRVVSGDNGTSLYDGDYFFSVPVCYCHQASEE